MDVPKEKTAFELLSNREQDSIRALVSGYVKKERTRESAINFAEQAKVYTTAGKNELRRQLDEKATELTGEIAGKMPTPEGSASKEEISKATVFFNPDAKEIEDEASKIAEDFDKGHN